jgi:hypothetical protein
MLNSKVIEKALNKLYRWLAVNCRQLVGSIFSHQYGNLFQDMGDWVTARSFLDVVPFLGLLVPGFCLQISVLNYLFLVILRRNGFATRSFRFTDYPYYHF